MTIRISELYGPVAQGEGALLGERMPFVRVAGCNLSCSWCDSSYTWKPGYAYLPMTPQQVVDGVLALPGADACLWVSITGGEPTLYSSLGEVVDTLWQQRHVRCIVETNGLRHPDWLYAQSVFVSCSPKLPGSGQDTPARRDKVRRFVQERAVVNTLRAHATQYKFVIATQEDLAALPDYCADVGIVPDGAPLDTLPLIYVQPDGYVQPIGRYLEHLAWLQEQAPAWVRVTPQVHRLVHGPDARGV